MISFAMPISGGFMPAQMALLMIICEAGFRPDIVFACSGGNVGAYIGLAANWDPIIIKELLKDLSKTVTFTSKTTMGSIMTALGFSGGNTGMYSDEGIEKFFRTHITPEVIKRTEIWTGSYNKLSNKSVFFCNRTRASSILKYETDTRITGAESAIYAGDDITTLYLASRSSATVPIMLPDVYIGQETYIDGGMIWSTPIIPLMTDFDTEHHIIHICGNNTDIPDMHIRNTNIMSETYNLFSIMSEGHIIQERLALVYRIKMFGKLINANVHRRYDINSSLDIVQELKEIIDTSRYSLLFIYPIYNRNTKLYDVKIDHMQHAIDLTKQYFTTELFYLV